jgi:hypothetical protein
MAFSTEWTLILGLAKMPFGLSRRSATTLACPACLARRLEDMATNKSRVKSKEWAAWLTARGGRLR